MNCFLNKTLQAVNGSARDLYVKKGDLKGVSITLSITEYSDRFWFPGATETRWVSDSLAQPFSSSYISNYYTSL